MPRNTSLDMLRGLMMALIALGHFGGPLAQWAWQPFGFVSAAEGFFLLSGLLFGKVYGGRAQRGLPHLLHAATQRALTLYRHQLAITACALVSVLWLGNNFGELAHLPALASEHPWRLLGLAGGMMLQARWLDILPMYVLFVLAAPWLLVQMQRGHGGWLLALSTALWGWDQLGGPGHLLTLPAGGVQTLFHWRAWQWLFVLGLWLGLRWQQGRPLALPRPLQAACLVLALGGLLLRHATTMLDAAELQPWLNRYQLGPARLLNVMVLAASLHWLARRGWLPRLPPLEQIGRQSLWVFSAQVAALYLLAPLRSALAQSGGQAEVAGGLCFLAGLWGLAHWRERQRRNGRRVPLPQTATA